MEIAPNKARHLCIEVSSPVSTVVHGTTGEHGSCVHERVLE